VVRLFETIPNRVTCIRLALIPILWILFLLKKPVAVAVGLIFAYVTDKLDGLLARLLKQKSPFGDALDSFTDHLLLPSIIVWLVIWRPLVFSNYRALGIVAVSMYATTIMVGLVRSKRFGGTHLLSARILGLFGYLFAVYTLFDDYCRPLYFITIVLVICFSIETTTYHFRKDLFQNKLHSIVLGLLKKDLKRRFIEYLL